MYTISIQLRSFADLEETLFITANAQAQVGKKRSKRQQSRKKLQTLRTPKGEGEDAPGIMLSTIPSTVPQDILTDVFDVAMDRAVSHWCCISVKVAPVTLDTIRDWHRAPVSIAYSIAAISLVSLVPSSSSSAKDAALALYARARRSVDDIPMQYDDVNNNNNKTSAAEFVDASTIMGYFCLSYTSNALRLGEHQHTWAVLAVIALRHRVHAFTQEGRLEDHNIKLCWYRWYYIDAWMSLALGRERLLPDNEPPPPSDPVHLGPYRFVLLGRYIRQYLQLLRTNRIHTYDQGLTAPSILCQTLIDELTTWYASIDATDMHLTACYYSVRLLLLARFLKPNSSPPTLTVIIDCLQNVLDLLVSFKRIRDSRCDHSTYHHLFVVIHHTATTLCHLSPLASLRHMAVEELKINLALMETTVAFATDTFDLRLHAAQCRRDLIALGIDPLPAYTTSHTVFRLDSRPSD